MKYESETFRERAIVTNRLACVLSVQRWAACALLLSFAACSTSSDDSPSAVQGDSGIYSAAPLAGSGAINNDIIGDARTNTSSITQLDAGWVRADAGGSRIDSSTGVAGEGAQLDAGSVSAEAGENPIDSSTGVTGVCTRSALKATVDQYYAALAAHDPSMVQLASNVKYTENGNTVDVGQGLWTTAGTVKFSRSALDTQACSSVSEAVIPEDTTDRVYGVRLKSENDKIKEIETLIIRDDAYYTPPSPQDLMDTVSDDWENELPVDQQPTREQLTDVVDRYFNLFPAGACNFSPDCIRLENGLSLIQCDFLLSCNATAELNSATAMMNTRTHVLDVEAGVAVGFTMWTGAFLDFHMFKIREGQVVGVHATLTAATSSGWD